ncbi:MAG TPA: PDZ domain-containing protein [Spirochaetia bacterium]|nr:PDZ domain-containing protein [Spirochaetia bacterium]
MVTPAFARRGLVIAAVLLAGTTPLAFSQSASDASPGHPSEPGVLVVSVQSGSPAETAGIVRGDIITNIDGNAVNTPRDVRQAIDSHKKGDTVQVKVRHGDAEKTLPVALGEKNGRAYIGVLLFPEERWHLGMRGPQDRGWPWGFSEGAFVVRVAPGGPADAAGVKRGDVILSVDGTQIDGDHGLATLIHAKKIGDTVTLSVRFVSMPPDKAPRDVKVILGAGPDKKTAWLGVEYRQAGPMAFMPGGDFPPAAGILPFDLGPSPDMPAPPKLDMPEAPQQPII